MRLIKLAVRVGLVVNMQLRYCTITSRQRFKVDFLLLILEAPTFVERQELSVGRILDRLIIGVVICDTKCVHEISTENLFCLKV